MSMDGMTAERGDFEGNERTTVGTVERWVSMAAGAGLIVNGIRQRNLLSLGLAAVGGALLYRGATGRSWLYRLRGTSTAGPRRGPNAEIGHNRGIKVEESITINQPPAELYQFWRNFENLPRFMDHVKSVEVRSDKHSHWDVKAPMGRTVSWDAEIINEVPNELIAWKSLDDADVPNAGSVRFKPAPGSFGTEVRVVLEYQPPAGRLGVTLAKLFGEEPTQQVKDDLRRLKQLMEAGEVATTQGQPAGAGRS